MKLLIVTQVIDIEHPVLGFFHRWVKEFAVHCEHVHVICLQSGKHNLPANVTVHSLGKEYGESRMKYLWRFYRYIWLLRNSYDRVFVHMNQLYVILGAPFWRATGKHIGLWYVHRQVTFSLRLATALVHKVFTSSVDSFLIKTNKVQHVGHGIDFTTFIPTGNTDISNEITVTYFGRITRIKNIDTILQAVAMTLHKNQITLNLYGSPQTEDDFLYQKELQVLAKKLSLTVNFCGAINISQVPGKLAEADISVNLVPPGGWDKTVLEAAACQVSVLTSNTSYKHLFGSYQADYVCKHTDSADVANKIDRLITISDSQRRKESMYIYTQARAYDLKHLIPKLIIF